MAVYWYPSHTLPALTYDAETWRLRKRVQHKLTAMRSTETTLEQLLEQLKPHFRAANEPFEAAACYAFTNTTFKVSKWE